MCAENLPPNPAESKFLRLRNRLIELYELGATHESIAQELGIAIPTVSLWLERLELPSRRSFDGGGAWWEERWLGDKSVIQMLKDIAAPLSLSQGDIRSILGLLTRRMIEGWNIQGRSLQEMILATVFLYIRAWRPPISAYQFSVACSNAGYYIRHTRILRLSKELQEKGVRVNSPKPEDILKKRQFALKKDFGIDDQILSDACSLITEARSKGLTHGKSPFSLAASALYLTTQGRTDRYVTEGELSRFFAITEVTIRNTNKVLGRFERKERYDKT